MSYSVVEFIWIVPVKDRYVMLSAQLLGIRRQLPKFDQENLPKNTEKVSLLERMVLAESEDIAPLVGTSHRTRLSENLKALDVTLTKEELGDLDRILALGAIKGDRDRAQTRHLSAKWDGRRYE